MQAMIDGAPQLVDRLGDASRAHFDGAAARCSPTAASRSTINPRLVRGLDYYNRTVFEWVTDRLGAQGTVAGGGRYDGLFEQLGGKPTPACGFAIGIERMVLLLQDAGASARTRAARLRRARRRRGRARSRGASAETLRDAGLRDRRQRRRRQLQVADEEGRCERRALRAHRSATTRPRAGTVGDQAAARDRRADRRSRSPSLAARARQLAH